MATPASRGIVTLITALFASFTLSLAQQQNNYVVFNTAIYVSSQPSPTPQLSPAVAPTCPGGTNSCSGISRPDWCCSDGQYCALDQNSNVGCCPNGQSCRGIAGAGAWNGNTVVEQTTTTEVAYVQTTTTTPAAYYWTSTTPVAVGAVPVKTITEKGPNLPTTVAGPDGPVLIVPESNGVNRAHNAGTGFLFMAFSTGVYLVVKLAVG